MMYVKSHPSKFRAVVAVCDKELIGKHFEEGNLQLDITERFYKGEELDEHSVVKIMEDADILNIVGKKSVDLAVKHDIISKNNILTIQGVPHAQFSKLS